MQTLIENFNEASLKIFADNMPLIVWMADSSGHVTFCNSKWYEYTGFEKDGNELENWASVFHPDDIESTMQLWNHSLQSGEGYEHEYRFASKNHPTYYRWFLARAKPLSDNNGKIICWVGTCTDVDDLKRTQHNLVEIQTKLELAFQATGIGICYLDITCNRLTAFGRLHELFGIDSNNSINKTEDLFTNIHADDIPKLENTFKNALNNDCPCNTEFRVMNPDGRFKWISGTGSVTCDKAGNPIRISIVYADITARKESELVLQQYHKSLKESRQALLTLTDNIPDIITRLDKQLRFTFINPAMEKLTGVSVQKLLGKSFLILNMPEELNQYFEEQLNKIFLTGTEATFEYELPKMNLWFMSLAVPEFDSEGQVTSILIVSRNITKRKIAERELLKSRELFKLVADTAPVNISYCDTEERILFANKAYANRFGLQPEDCVGKTVLELLGPEAYSVVAPNIKSALLGQYQNFETVVPYRNVGKQFMHLAFAPDFDETGKVRGLVAAIANVTARYKAENMLQELEARLKNFEVSEKQLTKQSISIAQSKGIRNLQLSDITHIEALQGYSVIHTTSGEKIMSSMNLSEYESLPALNKFNRVHRSYLVNLDHISELNTHNGLYVKLRNSVQIPVSRRRQKAVSDALKGIFNH